MPLRQELRYLDKSVALVLGFVGAKIISDFAGEWVPLLPPRCCCCCLHCCCLLLLLRRCCSHTLAFTPARTSATPTAAGYHVPTDVSLGVVTSILGVGVGASLLLPAPAESSEP